MIAAVTQARSSRRLRIRLKAGGPDELEAVLRQILTNRGIFVPSARTLPVGTSVTVELLYRDGRLAMSGQGQVRRLCEAPNPGMRIDVRWQSERTAGRRAGVRLRDVSPPPPARRSSSPKVVRVPGALTLVSASDVPKTEDLMVDAVSPVPCLFGGRAGPGEGDPPGRVPRGRSVTQMVIERGRSRHRSDTTYESRGSDEPDYVRPSGRSAFDDVTPLGRAAASLARIHLSPTSADAVPPVSRETPRSVTSAGGPRIGIDFGPKVVRVWVSAGSGASSTSSRAFESAVFLPKDARPLVGALACERLAADPVRGLTGLSRFLGVAFSGPEMVEARAAAGFVPSPGGRLGIRVDGAVRSVEELAAWLLLEARLSATEILDRPVRGALVACPGAYGLAARYALRGAAERAGIELAGIVQSPIAVARELAAGQAPGFQRFLVLDFETDAVEAAVVGIGPEAVRMLGLASDVRRAADPPGDGAVRAAKRALRTAGLSGEALDVVVLAGDQERDAQVMRAVADRVCDRIIDLEDAQVAASGIARLARDWGEPGAILVVQKVPGAVWLVDERGRMQPVLPEGADLPAQGRVRHRLEGAAERLFIAEELGGSMVPVAEVWLSALGGDAEVENVDLELTAHGDGALDVHASDARTRAPLGVELARRVGGFFEALKARCRTPSC